jgi:hypothetical protein
MPCSWDMLVFIFSVVQCWEYTKTSLWNSVPPDPVTSVQWCYKIVMKCLLITANKPTPFPKKKREVNTEVYIYRRLTWGVLEHSYGTLRGSCRT